MKRYGGWLIAGAVVVVLALFWVIGRSSMNEAQSPAESTPTSAGPTASSSPLGALNWSEEEEQEVPGTDLRLSAAWVSALTLSNAYRAVCAGEPHVDAVPYEGDIHPMVMIGPGAHDALGMEVWEEVVSEEDWFRDVTGEPIPAALRPASASQIQLVACVTEGQEPGGPSCGIYTRSDGVSGELLRTIGTVAVRVLVASTATEIERRTFTSEEVDECPQAWSGGISADPPWFLDGPAPFLDDAYGFLASYMTGAVR